MSIGSPIVLISGLLSNGRLWASLTPHLKNSLVVSPTQNSPEKMVDEILSVAPPQFTLVGHSMGGWLALEVMKKAPSRVVKLYLLNTTARGDSDDKRNRRLMAIERVKRGEFVKVVDEIVDLFVYRENVKPQVREMFLEVGPKVFISQEESMLKRDVSMLPLITCPTLIIHAEHDRNFSIEEHQELARKIPGAKLEVIKTSGHMSPMEAPEEIMLLFNDGNDRTI